MRTVTLMLLSILLLAGCRDIDDSHPNVPPPTNNPLPLDSFTGLKQRLVEIGGLTNVAERNTLLGAAWDTLRAHDLFPFVAGDSVAFLYRGDASSLTFAGDFNGWNPSPPQATKLGASDVWLQEEVFPLDARLDYKVVRDGSAWMLDPENPLVQRGGFGDNSELRMPGYVLSPYVDRQDGVAMGNLTSGSMNSSALGYTVEFEVYTPVGYAGLADLPTIYVTDGHEYADDAMGSMVIVVDNLIAGGLIRPLIAVFIDPRVNGENLRADQYILNPLFVTFVADELVPFIDATYRTSTDRRDRGILGTSLGGLNSAWFALQATDTFFRIGIQSPAFQVSDGVIVGMYEDSPRLDVDIFMSWGTINDFGETTLQFQAALDAKGYDYTHVVVNEGHSWGNWRALLDDVLVAFWPGE